MIVMFTTQVQILPLSSKVQALVVTNSVSNVSNV